MILPSLGIVVAINHAVRQQDEWFDEPDEIHRVQAILAVAAQFSDPLVAAAGLASRIARAQAFTEGNKRTALLVARWVLDRNGVDGARVLPADDRVVADLLVQAAMGADIEADLIELFNART